MRDDDIEIELRGDGAKELADGRIVLTRASSSSSGRSGWRGRPAVIMAAMFVGMPLYLLIDADLGFDLFSLCLSLSLCLLSGSHTTYPRNKDTNTFVISKEDRYDVKSSEEFLRVR